MSYWVVGWIAAAIGFVLGAAWAGLGIKNRQCDEHITAERRNRKNDNITGYYKDRRSGKS